MVSIGRRKSDSYNDFTDLVVGFHESVRLNDFLERKYSADDGLEVTFVDTVDLGGTRR
jgi:hypothetical protein